MSRYICGQDPRQMSLEPLCLDDMIAEDNPVRAIALIVDRMDISSQGFIYATNKRDRTEAIRPGGHV